MTISPLTPGLPGGAAEIEREVEYPLSRFSAAKSQALKSALTREYFNALRCTRFTSLTPLLVAGVSWRAITDAVPAHARITVSKDLFDFEGEGGSAFIVPARVESPLTPEATDPVETVRVGAIVDLIAFHPDHPARWALRTGAAEWLGAVEPQYLEPQPVPLWRTPLRWLQAGCRGLVLLSRERESEYRILSGLRVIVAEDQQHAAELRQQLGQPWPMPRVMVGPSREVRRAA